MQSDTKSAILSAQMLLTAQRKTEMSQEERNRLEAAIALLEVLVPPSVATPVYRQGSFVSVDKHPASFVKKQE